MKSGNLIRLLPKRRVYTRYHELLLLKKPPLTTRLKNHLYLFAILIREKYVNIEIKANKLTLSISKPTAIEQLKVN